MVKYKRNKSQILEIFWNDVWCTKGDQIRTAFFEPFRDFSQCKFDEPNFTLGSLNLLILNDEDAFNICREVISLEIEEALRLCPSSKAPGPDGYSMGFLRKMCVFIKQVVIAIVKYFFWSATLPIE